MTAAPLWTLRHLPTPAPPAPETGERPKPDEGGTRIRCPRCGWEPGRGDLWLCTCGHAWNTFETGGVCPECGHRWAETQCHRCQGWSRHEDWYAP